jgi:hypothetical protein
MSSAMLQKWRRLSATLEDQNKVTFVSTVAKFILENTDLKYISGKFSEIIFLVHFLLE